jgi:iron complex transport system substrate-binding protein
VTYRTPDGRRLQLSKHPRRTVVLLTSLLDLWYQAGGTAVGRCAGDLNVPFEARELPILGTFANPNIEKMIQLEPDLVIATDVGAFRAMVPLLEANGIAYLLVRYVNYTDYLALVELFSTINGNTTQGRRIVAGVSAQIDDFIAQIPPCRSPEC